jgi:hypothetical protein
MRLFHLTAHALLMHPFRAVNVDVELFDAIGLVIVMQECLVLARRGCGAQLHVPADAKRDPQDTRDTIYNSSHSSKPGYCQTREQVCRPAMRCLLDVWRINTVVHTKWGCSL